MKIAFLFLTIDQPYFTQAWEKYFENNQEKYNIYIHPKNKDSITHKLFKNNIVPNIKTTNWGFLIEAQISLLETALLQDKDNKKFILVSDSCLPIKNFDDLYNFLNTNKKNLTLTLYHNLNLLNNLLIKIININILNGSVLIDIM